MTEAIAPGRRALRLGAGVVAALLLGFAIGEATGWPFLAAPDRKSVV